MNKEAFLAALRNALTGLPQDDVEERLAFYGEMIDDRMEEGMTEEEAVAGLDPVDEIAAQTVADIPLTRLVRETMNPGRRLRAWEIVLLILGFPLWFPLLIAAGAVLLSLYIVIWSLLISLWAVEVSLWACAVAGIAAAVFFLFQGRFPTGLMALGIGLFCAGLSVFLFFGCLAASKGLLALTKKATRGVKSLFIRKEK